VRRRGAVFAAKAEREGWRIRDGKAKNAQRSVERIRKSSARPQT